MNKFLIVTMVAITAMMVAFFVFDAMDSNNHPDCPQVTYDPR